jgi:predicted O-linked N-acetylglucosamine transferase (SPINDLY family)
MKLIERLAQRLAARIGEPVDPAGREAAAEAAAMQLIDEGNELEDQGRLDDALAFYENAVQLAPGLARAHLNVGNICYAKGDLDGAIAAYRRALIRQPDHAGGHYNLGNALLAAHQPESALAAYERALAVRPDLLDAEVGRACALQDLGRLEEAEATLQGVLAAQPQRAPVWGNLGGLQASRKAYLEAASSYRRMLAAEPEGKGLGLLTSALLYACEWTELDSLRERVEAALQRGRCVISPFYLLPLVDDDAIQTRAGALYAAEHVPPAPQPLWNGELYRHERPRVAYVSADFHRHATAALIAGLIELHDRQRLETFAISFGPDDGSAIRKRLQSGFEHFIDAARWSDAAIAQWLRNAEIDLAIDLKGYTADARPRIFALRPCPLAVNWLGYPGSLGAPWMDYLIADPIVLPPERAAEFSEQIAWLPDSYQPNDHRRTIATDCPSRAELGLPDGALVFCCFNNNFKILPPVWAVWMRLLARFPDSVLWLLRDNADAEASLRRACAEAGIDPTRLVFAPRADLPEHLARHRAADLFLDTVPCNAHTTASDALYAGLPLITCRGGSFAGRVASSLLHAVGLPELIAEDLASYEALAIALASDRERLASLRSYLIAGRSCFPLFDTRRFTRHFEACLLHMVERQRQGLPPAAFAVTADGRIGERP